MRKLILTAVVLFLALFATNNLQSTVDSIERFFGQLGTQRQQSKTFSTSDAIKPSPPPVLASDDEKRRVQVIETALKSVVTIGINFTARERDRFSIDPFGFGFRRIPGRERTIEENIGSGFVVSENGHIITNRHVVDVVEAKYKVRLDDGTIYDVERIYRDPLNDLAILKINPKTKLQALPLGDSDTLKLGQSTIAIGTPLGKFPNSVTTGVISGLGRGISAGSPFEGSVERLDNVIQTDAAISSGNSGGPLLNSSGQVIGVNTAVSGEGENIGFAIPVNLVKELLSEFEKRGGSFERPFIGIRYQMIDQRTAIANNVVRGAYILEVLENSPAQRAGLRPDDIITAIDGEALNAKDEQSLVKILLQKRVGQTITVAFWRDGKTSSVRVTLEKYE
jgi:serine protease Do